MNLFAENKKWPGHRIYFLTLVFIAASLPLSKFTITLGFILLGVNWIVEGDFARKIRVLKERKSILVIISLYLLHLIGLLYTSDFTFALRDIKIKLPVFFLPLIIGTSATLTARQLRILLSIFAAAVFTGAVITLLVLFGVGGKEITDPREASVLIYHIRFSLLMNIGIFAAIYLYISSSGKNLFQLAGLALYVIFILITMLMLQVFSGLATFAATAFFLSLVMVIRLKNLWLKMAIIIVVIAGISGSVFYIVNQIKNFYNIEEHNPATIEKYTAQGNPYTHNFDDPFVENGYRVGLFVSRNEMRRAWNQRGAIAFDSVDPKGFKVAYTLTRYLTSRGLRKDSAGVAALTETDIKAIESGIANHIYVTEKGLKPRIYTTIWEIDRYRHGLTPNGHSITQRVEFLKGAFYIIRHNFWTGVGTGDLQMAYDQYYTDTNSALYKSNQRRAHNQYITFFIAFGIFGFLWALFALFYPVFYERKYNDYLFMVFFITAFLSMLNEDTLETHAGASFFMYFYALLLFGANSFKLFNRKPDEKQSI